MHDSGRNLSQTIAFVTQSSVMFPPIRECQSSEYHVFVLFSVLCSVNIFPFVQDSRFQAHL